MPEIDNTKFKFEADFWGNCANTIGEEIKQLVYARKMGLKLYPDWRSEFNINMQDAAVVDIGGGPVSLLLKCVNVKGVVVDPLAYPQWVYERYRSANIFCIHKRGEDLLKAVAPGFDEAWIYNVLQHTDDPIAIIDNAKKVARKIRIFEWIDIPAYPGHPWMLTEDMLNFALDNVGNTELLNDSGCNGRAFYGVFRYA